MKYTIVTVVYNAEYPLLLLQARSIAKFVSKDEVEEVIWLVNDLNEDQSNLHFRNEAATTILNSGLKLHIIQREKFPISEKYIVAEGWKHQQTLKILVARIVSTPHYLVLDSKNFFIRTVDEKTLFKNDKAVTFKWNCSPMLKPWLAASAEAMKFNMSTDDAILPTATPYLMNTQVVLDMLDEIAEPFDDFFYRHSGATEFFIYYCYLKKHNLVEKHYEFVPQFYQTFFTIWPSTPEQIKKTIDAAASSEVFAMGLHRSRFNNCTQDLRNYIFNLWLTHELIKNEAEFEYLFQSMKSPCAQKP